jgi:hypothetical protein
VFPRVLAVPLLAVLSACSGDLIAVVARVNPARTIESDAGEPNPDADGTGADAGQDGNWPAGTMWSLYYETGGEAQWVTPATATSVSVTARSPQNIRAGLAFDFAGGTELDLAQYDQVELTMAVTEGETFELFLGRGPNVGCSYVFTRGKSNRYTTNLSSPAWCVPSQCGFDLKVTGGLVLAYVPTDSRLTATITGLRFFSSSPGAKSGSVSALGGSKGPGGYCWFLVNWNNRESVSWFLTNPTSSSVHVLASSATNSLIGMAFEIPKDFRLSQYRTLVIDATVSGGASQTSAPFLVQAVKLSQGRGWVLQGDGTGQTYRIDLTQPGYYFGAGVGGQLGLDDVTRIEFVPQSNGGVATIDALVQSIDFQP